METAPKPIKERLDQALFRLRRTNLKAERIVLTEKDSVELSLSLPTARDVSFVTGGDTRYFGVALASGPASGIEVNGRFCALDEE